VKAEIGDAYMLETTVLDSHGTARTVRRLNPLLKTVEACETKMVVLSKTLGLTPVDREKAKPTRPHEDTSQPTPGTVDWILQEHAKKLSQDSDGLPA